MQQTIKVHMAALCGAIGLAVGGTASAVETHGVFNFGVDSGGDALTTVVFTDGHTSNVKAGEGIYFGGGVGLRAPEKKWAAEFSLAWKRGQINATNGNIYWTRYPLEALAFYVPIEKFRIGGGLTYHLNPKLKASGAGAGYVTNTDYKDALGFVLQGDYLASTQLSVGLRFTSIDYKPESGNTVSGNSVGLALGFHF